MNTKHTRDERFILRSSPRQVGAATENGRVTSGGFTLAEAMMATVVLGIAAAGVLLPFTSGARVQAEGVRRTLAAKLAGELMEQIINKPFNDPDGAFNPGPDGGETVFDNIDDYDGYFEAEGQIKDSQGQIITDSNYAKFSREASCKYVTVPTQPDQTDPAKCNFILVTVKVKYNGREIASIKRLMSR